MLKPLGYHVVFVTAFLGSFVLLLAVAMEGAGVVSGERGVALGWELFRRLQVNILGAGVFLLLSGFLPAYLALYTLFMRKSPRVRRMVLSTIVFSASFVFLYILIGESIGAHELWLFLLGVACVLVSDAIGEFARNAGRPNGVRPTGDRTGSGSLPNRP